MLEKKRDSGIASLGWVPWGAHICQFYSGQKDLIDVIVPYIMAGLRQNERCMWICSEPLPKRDVMKIMSGHLPNLGSLIESKQIAILSYDEWYLEEKRIDPLGICRKWFSSMEEAISLGFDGLRVTGNVSWVKESDFTALLKYEEMLGRTLCQIPQLSLCSYPFKHRSIRDVGRLIDIANQHNYALLKYGGVWEALRCSNPKEKELEILFNSISDSILIVDSSGKILAANQMCLWNLGVSSLIHLPQNLSDLLRLYDPKPITKSIEPGSKSLMPSGDAAAMATGVSQSQGASGTLPMILRHLEEYLWQLRYPSGDVKYFLVKVRSVTGSPDQWNQSGLLWHDRYVVVIQDVTHLQKMEKVKEDLLRMIAHDLGNPVQVIRSVVNLMKAKKGQEGSAGKYVDILEKKVSEVSMLLEDALMATVNEYPVSLRPVIVNLPELLRDMIEPYTADPDHEVIALFSQDKVLALVDLPKIKRILSNLLSNAVKYTPKGRKIWIDMGLKDEGVLIQVEDEGIGIPPSEIEDVFRPFYRGSNAVQNPSPDVAQGSICRGMGLGLYASRCLARMLGGDLWAQARPGGGTIMSLWLPLGTTEIDREDKEPLEGRKVL